MHPQPLYRWLHLTYCYKPITEVINEDGRYGRAKLHTYLPLNRRYKPLGVHSHDWVE